MPTDSIFEKWLDEQMASVLLALRTAVKPPLQAMYYEREANRKALTEKDARIAALALRNDELEGQNAELISDLAECREQNPPPPPPPPPPQPYDDRVQVIWPAGLVQGPIDSVIGSHDLKRVYACVLAADAQHYIWGPPLIRRLKDNGIKVFAYVRAPVHARIGKAKDYTDGIGPNSPFEHQVYELVKRADAWVRNPQGQVMYHPAGVDVYVTPWLVAEQHARLVREWVWKLGLFDGILADGLTTNQIYAGGGADFDRDGVADVVEEGWGVVSSLQGAALSDWLSGLEGIPVVGNGSWEPRVNPTTGQMESSLKWWLADAAGAMDEDITHPWYPYGDETKQGPALSQRWDMHRDCAETWLKAGKAYWLGSRARLHNLEREQERRFTLSTALLLGGKWVDNGKHEWLSKSLGKPTSEVFAGLYSLASDAEPYEGWERRFERGRVVVWPDRKDGQITFK